MSMRGLLLAVALISCGLAAHAAEKPAARAAEKPAGAPTIEPTAQALLDAIRSNRKAVVAVNLTLTEEEAGKFWPLYDRYQKEINGLGDRLVAIIKDYTENFSSLSDEKAAKILEDYLAVEADRVQVKRTYAPQFTAVLPGRKVARLYQIENKMDAVIRYDLAATIPVIEEQAAAK